MNTNLVDEPSCLNALASRALRFVLMWIVVFPACWYAECVVFIVGVLKVTGDAVNVTVQLVVVRWRKRVF